MNTGSTQPVTTTTQTASPWSGVQPYLSSMYASANAMQQGNVGFTPYQGPTIASFDPTVEQGLTNTTDIAGYQRANDFPLLEGGLASFGPIIQAQGITPQIQAAISGLGTVAGQYGQLYNQAQQQNNPYLQASIDAANRRGDEAIQSSMSAAGRYGSGQYQDVMSRAQSEVADPLLMQDYEARQQRALQATQGLGQTYGQQAGIEQQALGQAMQMEGMIPGLMQGMYTPAQMYLATGQYAQDYAQQGLQGAISQYNAQQAYPWQQLERESAILSGAGNLGGTTVTAQTPQQTSLMSRLAGGALLGGSLGSAGGPVGTGLGAGVGALAGAFL